MGRQHQQRRQRTREEQVAFLKAHGETEETIAALLAHSREDQRRAAEEVAAAGPRPAPTAKDVYRLRNLRAYNQALVQRGSLTVWFDEASIASWWAEHDPNKLGAPLVFSDTAILCVLTLKEVFRLPLRQTEGFVASLIHLLQLEVPVPDYSTLCRRGKTLDVPLGRQERDRPLHLVVDSTGLKVFGEGEWKVRQHSWTKRRTWRRLHLGVDEATGEIVAQVLTTNDVMDAAMLRPLLAQVEDEVLSQVSADGAYDTTDCYAAIVATGALAAIPPDVDARDWGSDGARDRTVRRVNEIGRQAWKGESDYHRRSLAEVAIYRLKTIFGPGVATRTLENQQTQAAIRCRALNTMTHLGMPDSYLFQRKAA